MHVSREARLTFLTRASQINSANELILTELILENTLATYEPEEIVALLSCFVFQEKTEVEPFFAPRLDEACHHCSLISFYSDTLTPSLSIHPTGSKGYSRHCRDDWTRPRFAQGPP